MRLKSLEIAGFKSFAKKEKLDFESSICAIVGPNGSGKSNIAEAFRFVLGEQSMKSMRGKRGEDLIFNGNNKISRQNKASVKLIFDNKDKLLKVDFEEVQIERTVHRDGVNDYFLNGSKVRLKDIQELLAGANIGASGHHIVSQGDADRILNTSIKERKAMLQDALGLRVFEYKKGESIRKLEKTSENIKEAETLRREIAPHIKFLKKQVEKVERAKEIRNNLKSLYIEYLSKEEKYLKEKESSLNKDILEPQKELDEINRKIEDIKKNIKSHENDEDEKQRLERKLNSIQIDKGEIKSKIFEITGQINSYNSIIKEEENRKAVINISEDEFEDLDQDIEKRKEDIEFQTDSIILKKMALDLFERIKVFINKFKKETSSLFKKDLVDKIEKLSIEKNRMALMIQDLENQESDILNLISLKKFDQSDINKNQLEIINLMNRKNELEIEISKIKNELKIIESELDEFKREISEGIVLIGKELLEYQSAEIVSNVLKEDRSIQKEKRKVLERLKIRLEETGAVGGQEIMKEFDDVVSRDQFLENEILDLKKSSDSLQKLIDELDQEMTKKFKDGLDKINYEFSRFFSLMFGGGEAKLQIEKEVSTINSFGDTNLFDITKTEEEVSEGIGISVNLPRKKVKSLMMLSGGERALTSIALLFAMSAVNPPPFVILDETDAALDEANSRKYGDMIYSLSKDSQLILVTHNRETMSRAGIIYGVTMTNGMSQVLSIKFDEAIKVAK